MLRKLSITFIFILSNFLINNISFSLEPDIFVQSTVNRAADTLGGSLSKAERIEELKKIAKDTVDIYGIGMYSLGSNRKSLSDDQLKTYNSVFENYFLKSFSSRLAEYSNPIIEVNSKEKINENYTIVSSTLVATEKRPEVKIEWRIYTKNPDKPLIRDLIIEGLSLARTQKEEFNSIIQGANGDINALFNNLKNFSNK
ncbi:MlaC/ttg2D family ABC transporter substrate-binding protein [Candidatus Pelagibacter sp.]|jgi:phospholipid transport system substrate-binding protein|uniref:MlaC/ttg2D family ABC transporter substrate-binding protein n=1 Tax=Candidatus Pelagibacter sp. TaxID=2024849 RepID=UPI003F874F27